MNEETISIGKRLFIARMCSRGWLYSDAVARWPEMDQEVREDWERYAKGPAGIEEYNKLTGTPKKVLRVINKRKEECKQSSV